MEKDSKKSKWAKAVLAAQAEKDPTPIPPPEREAPASMITFDRYFLLLGRPAHHKRGMIAYVKSTKGRKTRAEWDRLFQGY